MSNCSFAIQDPKYFLKYYTPGRVLNGKKYRQDTFTIHQVWGHCSAASLKSVLDNAKASCNYSIQDDGTITLMVDEANRSWCSSSSANDVRACTVECSNDRAWPYKCTDAVIDALINLCTDWCKRNNLHKMYWIPNLVPYPNPTTDAQKKENERVIAQKNDSLPQDEGLFTVHRWFFNKPCPGDYIEGKIQYICDEVNKNIASIQIGDIVPMEVTEIKDGYAYGRVKIDEPIPPVPKGIEVGSKVTINPGAKAGGLNDKYRGKAIDPKYANGKYVDTVNKIETHYGIEEARLQNIVTWVAVSDLTLVE